MGSFPYRAAYPARSARYAEAAAKLLVVRLGFGLAAALLCAAFLTAAPVAAHPLGNFTINHLTKMRVQPRRIDVRYVLDVAEIPTFAVMRAADPNGRMSGEQLRRWSQAEVATIVPQLELRLDGVQTALLADSAGARTRPGAGGLPLLYWVLDAHAPMAEGKHRFLYTDHTFAGRLGWKDVVVAPEQEPTRELLAYPSALLGSPRNTTSVTGSIAPSGTFRRDPAAQPDAIVTAGASAVRSNQLSDMLTRGTKEPLIVVFTLLVAIALGALHALEPGHGKTLLAVSLVGSRATVGQATILAMSLTLAHTIGVLLLGVAIIALKGYFIPESIYPWITLISGIVIAVIGAKAVARQVIARAPFAHTHRHHHAGAHPHDHVHQHHPHGQGQEHDHAHDDDAHARSHEAGRNASLRFGPTVWAAMSGGVAPCPAALVVLFAAMAQNVLAYGLVVIVFFSFGLAATLTALGIGVVHGASWLARRPRFDRVVRYAPLSSAIVISIIGSVMVGQGLVQQGIGVSAPLVTVLTVIAIAAYAFSHPLQHALSVRTT